MAKTSQSASLLPLSDQQVKLVSVIGGSVCTEEEAALAEEVGLLLAGRGVGVVCGGRGGVMEAACQGAAQIGGLTVGILPGSNAGEANPWVQVAIPTGLGEVRNALVASAGAGVIAIGGEYGTLSEIAFALKAGKRVAGLGTWDIPGVHAVGDAAAAVAHVLDTAESETQV